MAELSHLFSPIKIRNLEIKNRILSTGHDTTLPTNFVPNDALVAYQQARAEGGVGLIVMQVSGVHETARYTSHLLMATNDDCIPHYRKVAEAVHQHGCALFGQLFHPGREIMESSDGTAPVAYAPSAVPNERFHVMPRPMSLAMIQEVIEGYAAAARRLQAAGLDGVEVVASHGYLPAQFLNPRVNLRTDQYGGSFENRLRFLRDVVAAVRTATGPDFIIGLRISGDEKDADGLTDAESLEALVALDGSFDYFNIVAGSSASIGGAVHIAPPMAFPSGYVAPFGAAAKAKVKTPVFVAGRINQPQDGDKIIASGQADMVGMTRALICDPEMPAKAEAGKLDDIRACIACNQACIGHFHMGYPISCIQHPETGRELKYGKLQPAVVKKKVLIAGGGPGGMKAAAVAAARGHDVTLCEASPRLGGQALLAQLLPSRAEFGGIVTNLTREMELAGVNVRTRTEVTRELVEAEKPDVVIIATGAQPRTPEIEGAETAHVVNAWQVIRNEVNIGASVLIADWRCDWIGLGLAEKLARSGCRVRLAVDGYMAGQRVHQYVRDHWVGVLHDLGVEVIPYARLFGVDGSTVYLQHATSGAAMVVEEVDTLVASLGHERVHKLEDALAGLAVETHVIGDCLTPRTAEEAVLEGLKVAAVL
ncbi:FAD-dependent oxidoreductase [Dongia soli]|uniref:FAD-dependent oxidoreductase n=1 Tax=Dongia soli TaxID=600628 RepID=A0ABU5EGR0_9PROT|nr:FAD-dependent oxidoreductase [Dongia soli]MDY0885541.1 FAD-dependent oxidoreductase [Dongia soli]